MSKKQRPILIYLPECGIEPYLRTLAILANAVRVEGQKVYVTLCAKDLPHCLFMHMNRVDAGNIEAAKKKYCSTCYEKCLSVCERYNFIPLQLRKYNVSLPEELESKLFDPETELLKVAYEDFSVGKMSAYDFSLKTKYIFAEDLSQEHRFSLAYYIKNALFSLKYTEIIQEKLNPEYVLYFNEYVHCIAVRHIAQRYATQTISCSVVHHCGPAANRIVFDRRVLFVSTLKHNASWENYMHLPVSKQDVIETFNDVFYSFYGNFEHLFSPNKTTELSSLEKSLALQAHKKICVVYTSSYDEQFGFDNILKHLGVHPGYDTAFSTQIEWLQLLKSHVEKRNDIQIIVRIHPREGTKKTPYAAQHFFELQKAFPENSDNFIIVWPNDPISSYDLLEFADLVLVSWSTMGLEAARVGIPVLAYAGKVAYVDSQSIRIVTTPDKYLNTLDSMLKLNPVWEQFREGVRYSCWRIFMNSLYVGDTIEADFHKSSYWPKISKERTKTVKDIFEGRCESITEYNITQRKMSLHEDSNQEEKDALKKCIEAFIHVTFFPPKHSPLGSIPFNVYKEISQVFQMDNQGGKFVVPKVAHFVNLELLCYNTPIDRKEGFKKTRENKNLRILVSDGIENTYYAQGRIVKRRSKLIARLASYLW